MDANKKSVTLYTATLTEEQICLLEKWCDKRALPFFKVDYARFAFKDDGLNIVVYNSGKLVLQGKKTAQFIEFVLEPEITKSFNFGNERQNHPEWFVPHAGLDESGKGDFFGPLITACVIADGNMVDKWLESGLRDSKKVTSDAAIFRLEAIIRHTDGVVAEVCFAGMEKYNELYKKFGNLNKLLAWYHSKSLLNALDKRWVDKGLLDQFSKQKLVQQYLKNDFQLDQRVRAEDDPVVAAASVVARAEYIRQMKKISDLAGFKLSRGASKKVKDEAKTIVDKFGIDSLAKFAKLHFKTSGELNNADAE